MSKMIVADRVRAAKTTLWNWYFHRMRENTREGHEDLRDYYFLQSQFESRKRSGRKGAKTRKKLYG